MSWTEIFSEGRFSVGIGKQSDIVTEQTSVVWVDCEMPQVTYRAMQLDTARSSQSRGSRSAPLPGAVLPVLSIKFPVPAQPSDYDLTTDQPVAQGLLEAALLPIGDTNLQVGYAANNVTPSDANTVTLASETGELGGLFAAATAGTGTARLGWIKSMSGLGPYTATLFEDLAAQPANNDEQLATTTYYVTTSPSLQAWTVRVCGEDATQDRRYLGFIPESVTFAVEDDRLVCTIQGPCYGGEDLSNSSGGLKTLDAIQLLDAVTGSSRYTLASQTSTASNKVVIGEDLNDGTADPNGSCGLAEVSWSIAYKHHAVTAPSQTLGVYDVVIAAVDVTATVAVPAISDYEAAAKDNILTWAWENRAAVSLCCYWGTRAGRIYAQRLPAGHLQGYPERTMINGVEHWKGTLRAGHWSGDGGTTDAGRKPFAAAVG